MSFIASLILQDRIAMVSDSRVVSEPVSRAGTGKEADKGTGKEAAQKANIITVEDDHAQKLFKLTNTIGLSYVGVHQYPPRGLTLEAALEGFRRKPGNLDLSPVAMADALRDHLAAYWNGVDQSQFCFHLAGYYRGRPFLLVRFNPLPPADLVNHLHAPIPPWVLHINGADDASVCKALEGVKFPLFDRIPPPQVVNSLVDTTFRVIDRVPCCGGGVQVSVIMPNGITSFKAVRNLPRVVHGQYAPGKYGLKVDSGGAIYSSVFQTGSETSDTYIALTPEGVLEAYYQGKQNIGMWAGQNWGNMIFFEDGIATGQVYATSQYDPVLGGTKRQLVVWSRDTGSLRLHGPGIHLDSNYVNLAQSSSAQICVMGKIWDGLVPYIHNSGYIGYSNQRWNSGYFNILRATNLSQGDTCFEETSCPLCEKPFVPGDTVVLYVRHIDEEFLGTMCIPIHSGCQGIKKTLTREIQATEERYALKEDGSLEVYRMPKFEEVEEQVHRVKDGYELDERTGQFKKKALVVPVAKEGYSARLTPKTVKIFDERGNKVEVARSQVLKFYDDLTGLEVELSAIQEQIEVFPEQPATKEEAVEVVTVRRRRPVMKTVTVEVGGKAGAESPTTETSVEVSAEPSSAEPSANPSAEPDPNPA
ncbi:MAG: hypothetical protein K6T66_15720 [Peptococcaceae bacterium]|nr:hypothetical protein [Peptococcaceae bacterium]